MSYTTKSDIALDAIEEVYEWYPWGSRKTSRFLIGGQIVGTRCFFESGGVELETPQQDGQRHGTPYEWNEEGDEQQRAIRAIDHAPRLESKA